MELDVNLASYWPLECEIAHAFHPRIYVHRGKGLSVGAQRENEKERKKADMPSFHNRSNNLGRSTCCFYFLKVGQEVVILQAARLNCTSSAITSSLMIFFVAPPLSSFLAA